MCLYVADSEPYKAAVNMQLQTASKAEEWLQTPQGATAFHRAISQWRRDAGTSDYFVRGTL
jgi:hypothetical protein